MTANPLRSSRRAAQPAPYSMPPRAAGLHLRLVAVALAASAAFAPASALGQDASVISDVRLAARGGDYAEAFDRIDSIRSAGLKSKAHAALASEYAIVGNADLAAEQFGVASELAANTPMTRFERASAYAFLAMEKAKFEEFAGDAREALDNGVKLSDRLAGFEHDIALAELAFAASDAFGDADLALALAQRMSDPQFRRKVLDRIEAAAD